MHLHARPHLEVHTRSKSHSAVAGAAYRLGLRLYDEKAKVWHDFRKRELGEEIVRALTVAPTGAPDWATDPGQLWNRVEASEKRKDAQVARDYRIPIPFGLSDQDAGDLAEEMARFICLELNTPVSIGLHRDADRDALGNLKPSDKQGFHAHLYFPTRVLLGDEKGEAGGSRTGFGEKIPVLSNRNTGSLFVEMLNCKWSELANDFARGVGSNAAYEFKSYKRLGLNLTPQPTLGQAATAMERKGIYTNRGDSLREALALAHVYKQAHAKPLEAQRQQALEDYHRQRVDSPVLEERKPVVSARAASGVDNPHTRTLKKAASIFRGKTKAIDIFVPRQGSLAYRLRQAAPTPQNQQEADELERSLVLIEALDKAFATYHELQQQMDELLKIIEATRAASLDNQFQADQSRERRKVAHVQLRQWESQHRFRIRMVARMGGKPMDAHEKLRSKVQLHDNHVQELKKTILNQGVEVREMEKDLSALKVKQVEALSVIRNSVVKLDEAKSPMLPELMKTVEPTDLALVKEQLPVLFPPEDERATGQENAEIFSGTTPSPEKGGLHP